MGKEKKVKEGKASWMGSSKRRIENYMQQPIVTKMKRSVMCTFTHQSLQVKLHVAESDLIFIHIAVEDRAARGSSDNVTDGGTAKAEKRSGLTGNKPHSSVQIKTW
jgi:hypothetical protein